MKETFIATLSPMIVMFMCMLIGFILRIKKIIPETSDKTMSKMENYVFVPALIISNFSANCTIATLKEYYNIILYSLIALIVALIISIPLSKLFAGNDHYLRNIYKYALSFGNFGFMGNAIVPAILGAYDSSILYKYLLFTLPLNTAVYTWGVVLLIPRDKGKPNPLKNLLNPSFISIIIGALLGLTGISKSMPGFVISTIDYCKACMAPIAMILTGFVIGGYSIKPLLLNKKVYIASFLRLILIPIIILLSLYLFGASKFVMTLALFAYATPLGMNTVVFPSAYGGDSKTGASMALISHTLCVITIPLMFSALTALL